jgi:HD superfamily phosphohydrolase
MDRLDYLNRDSFYTGVSEGIIGSDRLIEMLNVKDGNLVLEEKGIYSAEKFIVARRIMYWQVYLHKTVTAAEQMLIHIMKRAKEISSRGMVLFASPSLSYFLQNDIQLDDFKNRTETLVHFSKLDDYDILSAIKVWQESDDKVLSFLCKRLINRELFKIEIAKESFSEERIQQEKDIAKQKFEFNDEELEYIIFHRKQTNNAYNKKKEKINILLKNGEIIDIAKASDNLNINALAQPVDKYCLCYPL